MKTTRIVFAPCEEQAKAWYGHTAWSESDLRKARRFKGKDYTQGWELWEVESEARRVK